MRLCSIVAAVLMSLSVQAGPIALDDLFSSPYMYVGNFSPDGQYLSLIVHEPDSRYLSVINNDTAMQMTVGKLGYKGTINQLSWVDADRFYLAMTINGRFSEFIINFSEADNKIRSDVRSIDTPGYVVSMLSESPTQLLFAKKRPHKDAGHELYVIDIENLLDEDFSSASKVSLPRQKAESYFYDDQSKRLVISLYDEDDDVMIFKGRRFGESKWQTIFTVADKEEKFIPIAWKNDEFMYVLSNARTDKMAVYEFDVPTQTLGKVLFEHDKYDITSVQVNPATNQLQAVSYQDHGKLTTEYLVNNVRKEGELLNEAFDDKQWYVIATEPSRNLSVIKTFSSDLPAKYYFYHADKKHAELISSAFPHLDGYEFAATELFTVTLDDGVEIEAYLTIPSEQTHHNTLLVMPHGGPIGVREYDSFSPTVQYFANRGYSVLRVNFRGSSGFGKNFLLSGTGQFGKQIEQDISAVVSHTLTQYAFDHVCSIGSSYGGYSAMMLAIKHPNIYDCVVAEFGVYDLPLLFNATNFKTQDSYREAIEKIVGDKNSLITEQSPAYLAKQVKAPVLLIAGYDDDIADFEHSHRMEYLLRKSGNTVESLYYKNTGHGHTTWWGDKHQNSFIDNYLRRTLGLSEIWNQDLTEQEKQSLAKEYVRLADSFNFESKVAKDFKRTERFYQLASHFGDNRATFNLGSFYYDGINADRDIDKAEKYFTLASDQGYATASLMLSEIYTNGLFAPQNQMKAYEFIEKAVEQDEYAESLLFKARALCLGIGIEKDFLQCLELLAFKEYDDDEVRKDIEVTEDDKKTRIKIIADILWHKSLTESELDTLSQTLSNELNVNYFPLEIEVEEEGFYAKQGREHVHVDETNTIPAAKDNQFGVKFRIDKIGFNVNKPKPTGIFFVWTRQLDNMPAERIHKGLLHGSSRGEWSLFYRLSDKQLDPAKWTLTIFDLKGKSIFYREYRVTNAQNIALH